MSFLNKILTLVLAFVFLIFSVSICFIYRSRVDYPVLKDNLPTESIYSFYDELGFIRSRLNSNEDEYNLVVVSPVLAYDKNDKIFLEELRVNRKEIKNTFISYFSCYTEKELKEKGEENIKKELLSSLNQNLASNKIKFIYFTDLQYLK